MNNHPLLTDFFRQEYGHLVATLCHKVGFNHIEEVEDAVQSALLKALENWTHKAMPEHPSAWLFTVASHNVIDTLRQKNHRTQLLQLHLENFTQESHQLQESQIQTEYHQQTLQWLFVCCHPSIAVKSQLVFALKTLCGFTIKEIALRLFISEDNAYKRYTRARNHLQKHPYQCSELKISHHLNRIDSINQVLYVLFTEGHLSTHLKQAIRRELCDDAIRLTTLLNNEYFNPQSSALLALMHLQAARLTARQDDHGNLLLLAEQDRNQWDKDHMNSGFHWLAQSARGQTFSSYHAQASIAAEHCLSSSFEQTRWDKIVKSYQLLEQVAPSAVHHLNAIVAMAQWQGPKVALEMLNDFQAPKWLTNTYQWHAVIADLHYRCHQAKTAKKHAEKAIKMAPNNAIKSTLKRRFIN